MCPLVKCPLISIIVPVYNAELYLEENIKGVLNQTYRNIEIIYICDGCTDRSIDILNKYKFDKRIRIIDRKNNLGAAESRNEGIRASHGEMVIFWDADDIPETMAIDKMVAMADRYDADLVICSFRDEVNRCNIEQAGLFDLLEKQIDTYPFYENNHLMSDLATGIICNAPFNKLVSRKLLQEGDIWFQNVPNCNDIYYSAAVFLRAKRVVYMRDELYYYRKDSSDNISQKRAKVRSYVLEALESVRSLIIKLGYHESIFQNYAFSEVLGYRGTGVYEAIMKQYLHSYRDTWNIEFRNQNLYCFDNKEMLRNKKIVIYGAGYVGKDYYADLKNEANIVAWVDSNPKSDNVQDVGYIRKIEYDYIVIATRSYDFYGQMYIRLKDMGIPEKCILYRYPRKVVSQKI